MNTVQPRQRGKLVKSFVANSWRFSVESLHERLCVEVVEVKGEGVGLRMKMRAKCLLNHDLPPRVSKSSSLTEGRKFKYLPLELVDHHREGKQERGIGKW